MGKLRPKISGLGPISKKVLSGLRKSINRKIIDISELRNAKIHAENLFVGAGPMAYQRVPGFRNEPSFLSLLDMIKETMGPRRGFLSGSFVGRRSSGAKIAA